MDKALIKLWDVIDALLGPNGCPWDKEQTPETLCDYVIEEAFELVDAIRSGNTNDVREELGDVFFLLMFITRLYADKEAMTLEQAFTDNAAKMIRRHPHVFDKLKIDGHEDIFKNWERIKRDEKKAASPEKATTYGSLPAGLPPLLKAYRIHSKAARVGFTWNSDQDLEKQLASEWNEWQDALKTENTQHQEQEYGDYLFTLVELGRRKGFKANAALAGANSKFLDRFNKMESLATNRGQELPDMSLEEMDALWDEVKAGE